MAEVENLLWPIYDLSVYNLSRPTTGRCHLKGCCVGFAASFLVATVITIACIASVHVAHVGHGGCMPSVLRSLHNNKNFTEDDVFRFKVVSTAQEPYISTDPNFFPDYEWSGKHEGVTLGQTSRVEHGFTVYNFTLPLGCTAAAGSGLDVFYSFALPPDVPAVNAAMYGAPGGLSSAGFMVNRLTRENWVWDEYSSASTSVFGGSTAGSTFSFFSRLAAVFRLLCVYFIMSTTTAMIVRLWVVALPAFMYPVIACISRWSPQQPPDPRILDDHFPWVGGYAAAARLQDQAAAMSALESGPLEAGRQQSEEGAPGTQGQTGAPASGVAVPVPVADPATAVDLDAGLLGASGVRESRQRRGRVLAALLGDTQNRHVSRIAGGASSSIFWAHLQHLLLSLLLYEAMSSLSGTFAFAFKSFPSELSVLVWSVLLLAEGFSAVYVRSLLSMTVFPRVHFILFALLYYYWVAFAYPYVIAAAVVYLLAVVVLMLGCLIWFEAPAYAAGQISMSRPRALLVLLPTAVTGRGLGGGVEHWAAPPLWSLFMRVSYRPIVPTGTAYDVNVPPVHDQQPVEGDGGVVNGGGRVVGGEGGREGALVRLLDGDVIAAGAPPPAAP